MEFLALLVNYGGTRSTEGLFGVLNVNLASTNVVHVGSVLANLASKDAVESHSSFELTLVRGVSTFNSLADFRSKLTKFLVVGAQSQLALRHVVSRRDLAGSSREHFS